MFNNEHFSDVKFVARGANGESESKQVIPAHKFVLSISSPVFEAMFYGELAETTDSIELPDCEYESLLELFRYMYSDEVNLSGSNLMGVLYLAKKYMVPSLAGKCAEYLQDNLDTSNVFDILPQAQKYEEEKLMEQCWKVIDEQTEVALKSDGFASIERSLLETVVVRDTLSIQEIELFKAVNLWATKRCEEQGLSLTDGSEKRRILGERIVKGIRFPVMTQYEFAAVVLDCKILTSDETSSVVKYLNSVPDAQVVFPVAKRTGLESFQRCCRFGSVVHTGLGYPYSPYKQDSLYFEVDKDISLLGVTLCGSRNCEYSVDLYVQRVESQFCHTMNVCSTRGKFSSECIKSILVSYYGFNVFFDRPVDIKKGVTYHLKASISGSANSCFGQNGQHSVVCSGVKFDFKNSLYSTNGTKVERGQFTGFLFIVK